MTDEATTAKPKKKRPTAAERRAQGKCGGCGKPWPVDAASDYCDSCRARCNRYNAKRYRARRKRGVCADCGVNTTRTKARCDDCRKRTNAEERARVAADKAAGLCISCRKAPAVKCGVCRDIHAKKCRGHNATRERRLEAGQCVTCGGPRIGEVHTSCGDCRRTAADKAKQRQDERIAAGLCRQCGKRKHVEGGTSCTRCRARRKHNKRDGVYGGD